MHIIDFSLDWKVRDAPPGRYEMGHLPNSKFLEFYSHCDDTAEHLMTLPTLPQFAELAARFGIRNDDSMIVIYDQYGFFAGPRGWFLFVYFGKRNVWLLDGGLPKWRELGFPTEAGPSATEYETIEIGEVREWEQHSELLVSYEQVRSFVVNGDSQTQLIDTRPIPWYIKMFGFYMIKRSKVLSFQSLVNKDKTIKSPEDIIATLRKVGASPDPSIRTISSCHAGVLACNLLAALAHCGNFNCVLFDGSYLEYKAKSRL